MGRFASAVESQPAQLAGTPSGLTFNGYFAAFVAGASANYKLRRVVLGVRGPAGSTTGQQNTIAIYRQTVRIAGTGFTTVVGGAMDPRGAASVTTGLDITNAAAAGTTGPTIGANPLYRLSFNTQSAWDFPIEGYEELICDQGTANGLAFVNIGNPLPASHLFTITVEVEE